MTLTSVVLPAPFGPIKPWIDPSTTSSDTPSTACTPPKWRRTSSRRSSTDSRSGPPRGPHQGKPAAADDSLRPEDDDRDQEEATEDIDVRSGVQKDVGQQRDDQRADHGAEHQSAASEDREGEDLDRACHAVLRVARIDEEIEVSLEGARVARDQRAEHERDHLVACDVD